jgi:outer membrane receptor protein involved in Fe transport
VLRKDSTAKIWIANSPCQLNQESTVKILVRNSFRLKTVTASAVAGIFLVLTLPLTALAQDDGSGGLEEVIVTATKRAETLQEVGMSITTLDTQELERLGAISLIDFAVRVPNLAMAYEADGRFDSSSPSIRGIFGTNTTGFYFDDTPVNASMLPRVMDLERIEVLRGPQGSLYGAKSMGGTIRMITNRPDLIESSSMAHATLSSVKEGDYNYNIDGILNIPVVEEKFAIRINAYYGENSGVFDRVYQPTWVDSGGNVRQSPGPAFTTNENVDDEKYWGGQIAAKFAITDNVDLDLRWMGQKVEADGLPFADHVPDNTTELRFFDTEEPGSDEWSIASGTLTWDVGVGSFVSTTSWYQRTTDEWEEEATFLHWLFDNVIGIPIDPIESPLSTVEKYDSFVHETRFSSEFESAFNFTAGVFYQDAEWDHHYPRAVQTGLADAIDEFTGVPGLGQDCVDGFCLTDDDLIFTTTTLTKTKEKALFGELTWEINDRWSITGGGRWYDTSIHAVNASDGFANSGPSSYDEKQSESGFNPKVLIQAKINDEHNLYATASKGFRIGGVNGNLPPGLCGPELAALGIDPSNATTFDSDSLWSYELGFKSTLADNRVTLNGAVFFIDWSDIQQLNRLACGFQFTQNAGNAESKGFELELMAAPTDGLTISAGLGYTDAEITDDGGVAGVAVGDKVQGVPDWTATASVQYIWPAFGSWDGLVRGDGNYYGDSYSANNESVGANARLRESWSALNLRVGIVNEQWDLIIFADNVTDERASLADSRSIAAETPTRQRLVVTRPRTIGVEARFRF